MKAPKELVWGLAIAGIIVLVMLMAMEMGFFEEAENIHNTRELLKP